MHFIKLVGLKNPAAVRSHFAACLVDVAGVTEISGEGATVEVDESIDLQDDSDRTWVTDLIRKELARCGESQTQIQIV